MIDKKWMMILHLAEHDFMSCNVTFFSCHHDLHSLDDFKASFRRCYGFILAIVFTHSDPIDDVDLALSS